MKSNDRNIFEEQCASYVLGALDSSEANQFANRLAHVDPASLAFFHSMQEVAWMIPLSVEAIVPPSHIKQQLMREIHRRKHQPQPNQTSFLTSIWRSLALSWSLATLCLLVAGGMGLLSWQLSHQYAGSQRQLQTAQTLHRQTNRQLSALQQTNAQQQQTLQQQERRILALRDTLEKQRRLIELMAAQQVQLVHLQVPKQQPLRPFFGGYGKLVWDPQTNKALLQLAGLPVYPNKDYQLWLLEPGRKLPHKAGVYVYQGDRYHFYPAPVPSPQRKHRIQFAVSLEPKGGSPLPTPSGPVMMMSSRISL